MTEDFENDFDDETEAKDPYANEPDMATNSRFGLDKLKISPKVTSVILLLTALLIVVVAGYLLKFFVNERLPVMEGVAGLTKLEKFASNEEFNDYFTKSETDISFFGMGRAGFDVAVPALEPLTAETGDIALKETGMPVDRYSQTNVQVAAIDEPDIVKTDGKNIYYSSSFYNFLRFDTPVTNFPSVDLPSSEEAEIQPMSPPEDEVGADSEGQSPLMSETSRLPVPRDLSTTKILEAYPPEELKELSTISEQGEMLLSGNNLLIVSGNKIVGYNISDKLNPGKSWDYELENNNQLLSMRLYDGKVYLAVQNYINTFTPCPMPLIKGTNSITIACTDIYRPGIYIPVNSTISIIALNPETGEIENKVSFVGSAGSSVFYMSENNIYVTYTYQTSVFDYLYKFFTEEGRGLVPDGLVERLRVIKGYDLKENTKVTEFYAILEEYYQSLGSDERRKLENDMENKMREFGQKHGRELMQSGIAKVALNNFEVGSIGVVPGMPLNQFSLDEYQGNLRIATTVGSIWGFGGGESESDVYVLNEQMQIVGSALGMGKGERIYSARFVEDKGYVVTFRQIDPFYVIDLSDPKAPEIKGELKIPGYSSYLHPINKDRILGVGMEDWNVKISLFDVSNPTDPVEKSKYVMDEFWSEAVNNHRAFLMDIKHNIFFLPGGNSGYIFSFTGDEINLIRAVADISAKRALYINDYLYVLGGDKIVVLDQSNWETVKSFSF